MSRTMSNNKLFNLYLRQQANIERVSLQDVEFIKKCRNQWKAMCDTEKAKFGYSCPPQEPSMKMKPLARVMDDLDMWLDMEHMKGQLEDRLIADMFDFKPRDEIMSKHFFVMSSNVQCVINQEFRPLEIGLVKYSIGDGVESWYNQFIDCGDVPIGFRADAKEHMEMSHKIPLKEFGLASDKYDMIGATIAHYLEGSRCFFSVDNPMIVFSRIDQMEQNAGCLKWIARKCNEMLKEKKKPLIRFDIRVLNASKLMFTLMANGKSPQSIQWCDDVVTSPAFDYTLGTDCHYHTDIECIDCALGVAKRITYVISHYMLRVYKVEAQRTHYPTVEPIKGLAVKEEIDPKTEGIEGLVAKLKEAVLIPKEEEKKVSEEINKEESEEVKVCS